MTKRTNEIKCIKDSAENPIIVKDKWLVQWRNEGYNGYFSITNLDNPSEALSYCEIKVIVRDWKIGVDQENEQIIISRTSTFCEDIAKCAISDAIENYKTAKQKASTFQLLYSTFKA